MIIIKITLLAIAETKNALFERDTKNCSHLALFLNWIKKCMVNEHLKNLILNYYYRVGILFKKGRQENEEKRHLLSARYKYHISKITLLIIIIIHKN